MKNNAAVLETINKDHTNEVGVVCHAEWNMNRYYRTVVDNTPTEDSEGYDIEMFPIESIVRPDRPTAGICKAMVGQSFTASGSSREVPDARFYIGDVDDEYKYWQSPYVSSESTFNMSDCSPHVLYVEEEDVSGSAVEKNVLTNKIAFTVESTYAKPTEYLVQVKTASGSWSTVASNVSVGSTGKVELWYTSSGWSTTRDLSTQTYLSGVRLVITKMDKVAYFNLIELGLRYEADLSDDVITFEHASSMGEPDFITPLGTISSNSGSVTLFSETGRYDNENEESLFYNLLDKGVKFTVQTRYGSETVYEMVMNSDKWEESDDEVVAQLIDDSEFFMKIKPRPVLYRDVSAQEVVWRICDMIGYNNYEVSDIDTNSTIDIFWTDGEKTAWEIFSELSRGTQTAVYFDSYGVLQVKTRSAAWNPASDETFVFTRDGEADGTIANIVSLSESSDYEANKVLVNWTPTDFSETRDNIVPFEVVWEPDGDVVLRSTELAKNFLVGDSTITLVADEGKTWPWKGMFNIEGEWVAYDAKHYIWYDADNVRRTSWIQTLEEQKEKDEQSGPFYRHMNQYTGILRISERGLFNTAEKDHRIDLVGWTGTRRRNYTNDYSPCSGFKLNRGQSSLTIEGPSNIDSDDYTYLHRGNSLDAGYRYLGMRMKIDNSAHRDKVAGIFFNAGGGIGTGYFLEVIATARLTGKARNYRNEVIFYSMKADGSKKILGGEVVSIPDNSKNSPKNAVIKRNTGARLAVPMDRYIDFDIWQDYSQPDHKVRIFANGQFLFEAVIENGSGWKQSAVSRFGLYTRGHTKATFDYIYGMWAADTDITDSESYYDRISGGYYSTQAPDWTYGVRDRRRKVRKRWTKYRQRYVQRFFNEFGPLAHELREFDVKFTSETPVLESKLYFSNDSQAVCSEFVGGTSGAKFIMGNISRQNAIVSGDDELTAMGNGTINHKLFVYGRPVIQKDPETIEKNDEWAQRRRGVIDIEYASPWIQNKDAAEDFAEWLTTNWSRTDSTLEMEVFGNPLIELTDLVRVRYENIDAPYYVVSINNSFDNGLTTTLTLRKATIPEV